MNVYMDVLGDGEYILFMEGTVEYDEDGAHLISEGEAVDVLSFDEDGYLTDTAGNVLNYIGDSLPTG